MDAKAFLRELMTSRHYQGQAVHVRELPPREAVYATPSQPLPEVLASVLRRQNIHQLSSHQAAALDAIAAGKDVVIVTGTASGKTLCYNLPVVEALLKDPSARAMHIFPTKALAQDQLGSLQRWAGQDESVGAVLTPAVYDGDTPGAMVRSSFDLTMQV